MEAENETLGPKFDDLLEPAELELRRAELSGGVRLGVKELLTELDLLNDAVPADGRDEAVRVADASDAEAAVKFEEALDRRQEVDAVCRFRNPSKN